MRKWLSNHFYDFLDEPRLLNRLLKFIEDHESDLEKWALQLRLIIQEKVRSLKLYFISITQILFHFDHSNFITQILFHFYHSNFISFLIV